MAIAAVPLIAGAAGTGGAVMSVMGAAAAATAATAAATASIGAMVAATALVGVGSMVMMSQMGGNDEAAPQATVAELDPTAADELETEQERNANLRRKIYTDDNLLSKETANETEGLTLLGA